MANWSDLKNAVASIIKTNGAQEITGQLLQNVLNNIISNVGLNSSFAGIATPETNPGTPDGNVFYLATTAGTYSNFNGIVINSGEAVILEWKGSWTKKDSGFSTKENLSKMQEETEAKLSELGSEVGGRLNDIEGFDYQNEYNFTQDDEVYQFFNDLNIKKGESFKIIATGSASWPSKRLYVYQGEWATRDFYIFLNKDEEVEVIADVDIKSLNVRYDYSSGFGVVNLRVYKTGKLVEVVDNLNSTESNKALSANQGKVLDKKYDNAISAISSNEVLFESYNLIDKSLLIQGKYLDAKGGLSTNANMCVSAFFRVEEGQIYTYTSWSGQSNRRYIYSYAFYDVYYNFISCSVGNVSSFEVPLSAKYARVTLYLTALDTAILVKGDSVGNYEDYKPMLPNKYIESKHKGKLFVSQDVDALNNGEYINLPFKNSISRSEFLTMNANIVTFDKISIGAFLGTSTVKWVIKIDIDNTNMTVYPYGDNVGTAYPHNLNIANNIQVSLDCGRLFGGRVTIISNGVLFQKDIPWNRRYTCNPRVESVGSELTNCTFSWTCKDLKKDIWMFGDSYFSYTDRWPYYLHQFGYDVNVLMDSYPGENSANAVISLKNLLTLATPKTIVWCHGMNDGSDDGSYTEAWKNGIDEVISLCEENDIELVLATIPTVPTRLHTYKNSFVRSSGYRYIDFNRAVGASSDGSWFSGMLSSDGVHPTDLGAKALFGRVLVDLPEICVEN